LAAEALLNGKLDKPDDGRGSQLGLDEGIEEAIRRLLAHHLHQLETHLENVADGESETIHQFRVTLRRIRSTIELFAPILYRQRLSFYRTALASAGRCAGFARDCDVIADLLRQTAAQLEPTEARALLPLYQSLGDYRLQKLRLIKDLIDSRSFAVLTERLAKPLLRKPPVVSIQGFAPTALAPLIRDLRRAGAGLDAQSSSPALHRLRVRVKRLRYAFEMLEPLADRQSAKALRWLRRLQHELGEHQDLAGAGHWLREHAAREGLPPETLLAMGRLLQIYSQRRRKVAMRALETWRKMESTTIIMRARDEIAGMESAHYGLAPNRAISA
jgi:CHAD domain-containing protein